MGARLLIFFSFNPHPPSRWRAWLHYPHPRGRTSGAQGDGGTCPGHTENSGPAELCAPDPLILKPKVPPTLQYYFLPQKARGAALPRGSQVAILCPAFPSRATAIAVR